MEPAVVAETAVELWILVDSKLTARKLDNLMVEAKIEIFKEAMHLYITGLINEKKYPGKPKEGEPVPAIQCVKCGRVLTDGEMDYLKGSTGKDRVCYHCSH